MRNLNPISPLFAQSTALIANLNINYTFIKKRLNLIGGFNYSKNIFSQGEVTLIGPMIGAGKSFFKDRLSTSFSSGFMQNRFSQTNDVGMTINASLNMNYRLDKRNNFILNIRAIRNTASNPVSIPFSEGFFTAGYQLQIQ
jgi:hypothetical protein